MQLSIIIINPVITAITIISIIKLRYIDYFLSLF
nr:MAG TPA: hypothetical protein [Crassvirales sp.]